MPVPNSTKSQSLDPQPAPHYRHVALLRGINVGGHRMIKKDELQAIFEGRGFSDVRTVLASGNVVFSSESTSERQLTETIESALEDALDYRVDVMVRTISYLRQLLALDPFGEVGPGDGHNYVTFLTRSPESVPELPMNLPEQYALALGLNEREFFSVSYKRPDGRYGDFGPYMKQAFGKQPVTTRNWKTIVKLAAM
jgi:uncharacterized protein (DUF1697 family)